MRILFDQGTPAPLRQALKDHEVSTAYELGWSTLANGDLIATADASFDVLITTDKNIQHQQNLAGRRLAVIILPTTSWPRLRQHVGLIIDAVDGAVPGQYREVLFPRS
jgi:predicted nuclease of predicted toxin-antitoxin system